MYMSCVAQKEKLLLDFCIDALTTTKIKHDIKRVIKPQGF